MILKSKQNNGYNIIIIVYYEHVSDEIERFFLVEHTFIEILLLY